MKSTLRRSAHLLLAVASPLATLIACEKIAGIDDMSAYEDTGDAGIASCTLGAAPPPAHTALRFGNLTPSADTVDFCVKPSTAPSYGPTTMLKQFGNCPAVSYGQVLIPLGVEPGTYDIKVVAGSASNCSAAALSEILGVQVPDQRTVTVLRMGGVGDAAQKVAEKLVALPEVRFPMGQSTRLVNAIASTEKILFGLVESDHLPTKVTLTIGGEIPMGGTPAATDKALGIGPINDAGYFSSHQTAFNFGASRSGQQDAVLIAVLTPSPMYTIYAVGLPGSYEYPVRALICREDKLQGAGTNGVTADYRTNCELSPLKQITIDTVNIGLYGANAPFLEQRRDPALEALANLDSDVLCVQEIPRAADREQLITNAKAKWVAAQQDQRPWEKMSGFPYAFNPTFDLNTQFDDPLDQSGNRPPSLGPYCADSLTRMQAAIDCTAKNCAADPGNPNSTIARDHTNCLSRKCTKDYMVLLSSSLAPDKRCYTCLVMQLLSFETIADTATFCGTDPNPQFAFRGASPEVMLSKYPLSDTRAYVLPSFLYRRAVLGAKANIGTEGEPELVNVFCSQFSHVHGSMLPYTGPYGAAMTVDGIGEPLTGWASEQYLQAQRSIAWIKSRVVDNGLAIIAGDLASGDTDAPDLAEFNPATVRLFRATFPEAVPAGYQPACTCCAVPENPYGGSTSFWLAHIFTGRTMGVLSANRILTERNAVGLPEEPTQGPVSDHYGFRSVIFDPTW